MIGPEGYLDTQRQTDRQPDREKDKLTKPIYCIEQGSL